jgi:hypothetical protein
MREVPADLKQMLARMLAISTVATDPGHVVQLSGNFLIYVTAALAAKYEGEIPPEITTVLQQARDGHMAALLEHGESAERWPHGADEMP